MDFLCEYEENNKKEYASIGIVFGSLTGSCIALARLSNKRLLRKLYVRVFIKKKRQLTDTMLSMMKSDISINYEASCLADFFDNITNEVRN